MFVPALCLMTLFSLASADFSPGFSKYTSSGHNPSGLKRYALGVYTKAQWQDAFNYCYDHGMNIASITTREEQEQMTDLIKKTEGFSKETYWWIGGNDAGHEGHFIWKGPDVPLTYSNWHSGQPDNYGKQEHCLELWNKPHHEYGWNDRVCNKEYFFICEHYNSTYPYDYV